MDRRIIELYDEYTHAPLARRDFLERLAALAGGMSSALALLPLLANRAAAAQVPADDKRLRAEPVTVNVSRGSSVVATRGYAVRPVEPKALPGVLVIHENRGLNAHIEDVARRLALAGFAVLAPDFLSVNGGTPDNEDLAREQIGKLDAQATLQTALGAAEWLRSSERSTGRVGAVGFCWGGGLVGRLATADPALTAAVVFYGKVPPLAEVPKIKAALLLNYAGNDERINADVPAFQKALDEARVRYTLHRYPGVEHAFHNDTSAARYNEAAAELAWKRTVEFFDKTLKSA
ncbi:MAG TPA: dienelactone hydrolase family protein [Steroidobacteraceae bacterium]|nr:dienelactone hydrolase family protein [Steroidobacteraceae bacterium]